MRASYGVSLIMISENQTALQKTTLCQSSPIKSGSGGGINIGSGSDSGSGSGSGISSDEGMEYALDWHHWITLLARLVMPSNNTVSGVLLSNGMVNDTGMRLMLYGRQGISFNWPISSLFKSLSKLTTKKPSKLCILAISGRNPLITCGFPTQRDSNMSMPSCHETQHLQCL